MNKIIQIQNFRVSSVIFVLAHSNLQYIYTVCIKMVQSKIFFLRMKFVQKVCVFDTISKWNKCSFCWFLNHIFCFYESRFMPRFVRWGKIPFDTHTHTHTHTHTRAHTHAHTLITVCVLYVWCVGHVILSTHIHTYIHTHTIKQLHNN